MASQIVEDSDFVHIFEDVTKVKIPPDIKAPVLTFVVIEMLTDRYQNFRPFNTYSRLQVDNFEKDLFVQHYQK